MPVKCRNCPIRKLQAFVPMTQEEIQAMERFKAGELAVEAGTPLLMQGSNSPQIFTALSGQGVRSMALPNGRRQVINFIFPGDFLGLQAAVMSEMQHSAEAVTDMVLCVFDRAGLWNFFKSHPERAYDMTWLCAVEEHFLGESLLALGQRSATERVAWAYLRIWVRLDSLGLSRDNSVPLPHRQQDLADALGLSLVHTNKTIAKLRRLQVASWSDGKLSISDFERLEEMAQSSRDEADKPRPLF